MPKSLEIIPAALFLAKMGVDTHVTGCSRQALVFAVRDMATRLWVNVFF